MQGYDHSLTHVSAGLICSTRAGMAQEMRTAILGISCVRVGSIMSIDNTVRGCETHPHTKFFTETFIATDKTEKYTDVRVILAQLSGDSWNRE